MPKTERPGRPPRPVPQSNSRPQYNPSVINPQELEELRERWQSGEALTGAELARLAEAGDDDALDELFARQHDDYQPIPKGDL